MPTHTKKFLATQFPDLTPAQLDVINQFCIEKNYAKGELIVGQGSAGGDLFCIISGKVEAQVVLPGDFSKTATIFKSGDFFGEIGFLGTHTIAASSIAINAVCCLVLPQNILGLLRVAYPDIAYKIEKNIANKVNEKVVFHFLRIQALLKTPVIEKYQLPTHSASLPNKKATRCKLDHPLDPYTLIKIPFFSSFSNQDIALLLPLMQAYRVEKGYPFSGRDTEQTISIICSGAVMFFIRNSEVLLRALAVYGVGKLFVNNTRGWNNLAAYVSCEHSVILQLRAEVYEALYTTEPALFYQISRFIHQTSVDNLYVLNREFVRFNSEYSDILS